MHRQIRSLLLAGFVACCATPVFAAPSGSAEPAEEAEQTTVAVQRISLPDSGVRDEVAMVLVGTVLIGLAAAVRRAA
jgi:hypothetical protein